MAQKGFTMVELLVVIAIIGVLGAIAVPQLVGAREKTRFNACDAFFHTLDPELINTLEQLEGEGHPTPANETISRVTQRANGDGARNPRNLTQVGFVHATSSVLPSIDDGCQVYFYDGTPASGRPPTIVVTQYHDVIRSFQIAMD